MWPGVFFTDPSDGLGRLATRILVKQGHAVVLHAYSELHDHEALAAVLDASGVLTGSLASLSEVRALAKWANTFGSFDAVVHVSAVHSP